MAPPRRSLRVAVDATPLLGQPTGVGTFVAGALAALARRPELVVAGYALSMRNARRLPAVLPAGVAARARPAPAAALLRLWSRLDLPAGTLWTGTSDVVHGTNFVVPPRRGPAVVTVHDLTPLRFPELASPSTRLFPALVRRAVDRGAWVHTPSAFVAAEVIDLLGVPDERVRAVAHGGPVAAAAGSSPVAGPYVLALGTVEPRKDLPLLVSAFDAVAAREPDLRLVIAGPDGWGVAALEEALGRAEHRHRVVRLGWLPPGRRDALLAGAAVFAFPSRYEGFGFPPLEAMAAGVPVVATRAGALPEVLGDAAVLVEPGDAAGLAEALEQVLGDGEVRQGLLERGARRVQAFTWERCAAGLAELYADAAG